MPERFRAIKKMVLDFKWIERYFKNKIAEHKERLGMNSNQNGKAMKAKQIQMSSLAKGKGVEDDHEDADEESAKAFSFPGAVNVLDAYILEKESLDKTVGKGKHTFDGTSNP